MSGPIRPDHPGMTTPGTPGGSRLLCPFCDWYMDEPPMPTMLTDVPHHLRRGALPALPPMVRDTIQERINGAVTEMARRHFDAIERECVAHMETHVEEMVDP